MNQLTIIGNLVRDPETGTTDSGINWCRFVVAARKKRPKQGEPDAEFVRVTAWRGLGDTCARYLAKGKKVAVVGEPRVHAWISRDGAEARGEMEMNADDVEFLSPGGGRSEPTDADAPPAGGHAQQQEMPIAGSAGGGAADPAGFTQVETDELPF